MAAATAYTGGDVFDRLRVGYGLGLVFFFGLVRGIATASLLPSNSIEPHMDWIITRCPGKDSFFRHTRVLFGAGLYPAPGLEVCSSLCSSQSPSASGRLFSRHASGELIISQSPGAPYTAAVLGTVVRTIGYIVAALVCSAFVHHIDHVWSFAIR